jgi:hypothetical protein
VLDRDRRDAFGEGRALVRTTEERIADVRRLLAAAHAVHADRARIAPAIAASTELSPEGVELGFDSLEREATDAELRGLVAVAGDAPHVHVVLSANVFVAPLRALALARAASPSVSIRPSPRDPILTRALVVTARDPAIVLTDERGVSRIPPGEVHVYGRDATIAAVHAAVPSGVTVRGHGAGMGVAVVSHACDLQEAARALAGDVVAFDQRGCLSPRVAFVLGSSDRANVFARALGDALASWQERVPRGRLAGDELEAAARWRDVTPFAGSLHASPAYAVAVVPAFDAYLVPPPGRHVLVVPVPDAASAADLLAPLAQHVVAVGSDDPSTPAPPHARRSALGAMQRPPLDGPVDLRPSSGSVPRDA